MAIVSTLAILVSLWTTVAPSQPCCSPPQFLAGVIQRRGSYNRQTDTASAYHDHVTLVYDYLNRRIASVERKYNTTFEERVHTIQDYKKGLLYTIINDKSCRKTPLSGTNMTSPCFLSDAQSLGDHNVQGLAVSTWIKEYPDGSTFRAAVDKANCLLVTSTSLSAGPDFQLVYSVYENITSGTDPSSFVVPDVCNTITTVANRKSRDSPFPHLFW